MGFYLRKSISVGGVKGLRFGVGPRGNYVPISVTKTGGRIICGTIRGQATYCNIQPVPFCYRPKY